MWCSGTQRVQATPLFARLNTAAMRSGGFVARADGVVDGGGIDLSSDAPTSRTWAAQLILGGLRSEEVSPAPNSQGTAPHASPPGAAWTETSTPKHHKRGSAGRSCASAKPF
ncbi:MAG: hypothetical protein R3C68_11795 [Myxococcota bacterium]